MANVCCYGLSNKSGALMILQFSVLTGIYLLARECVELFLKPREIAVWKMFYLFVSPGIEIIFTVMGIFAVKKTRPVFLLPLLLYKLVYIVLYLIILFSLPFVLSYISSDSFINELKAQFNMDGGHVVDILSPISTALMMVFISTLLFPMEELLRMSKTVIISVYSSYLCIVTVVQMYFIVVLYMDLRDMLKEIERAQVRRYVVQPVPGITTYSVAPPGASLPYVPAPQRVNVKVNEPKFRLTPPYANIN